MTLSIPAKRLQMSSGMDKIALMGSGELTATMVAVHKDLLRQLQGSPQAVHAGT
jgi:hypothetical protein